jgi:hypothetical protein
MNDLHRGSKEIIKFLKKLNSISWDIKRIYKNEELVL